MRCPTCGEENSERARFCQNCGAALSEPARATGQERKVVSVLFVDLVGFTARSDTADPEDVQATLRPYHALLKREIERFGGTVEKFIGDAVMAVFGAPVAHEDDAERAVRSALRIVEAIPELNQEHPGLELSVRAAVNTGEAVVSLGAQPEHGEGFVAGDVVNTASRMQQLAPVGGVVVGEVTERATRHAIDYEALEPAAVKGKAEPVALWRAVAARARFGVDVERPPTPFIGRERDLALLQDAYHRTLGEAAVQLVTVVGEPGVGKTRLVAEFQAWVDDQPEIVFWRQGRCLPYGDGITYWALGEIVKGQAGILESDGPEEAHRKVTEAIATFVESENDREWVAARLSPLVGAAGGESAERSESFAAWRTFLEAVAAARPLVTVVEDLHWADQTMLEFLEHLVDWSTGVPMLVLATARPELYERAAGWGGGKRNSTTLALSPLSGNETARLISALLEQAVLPAEVQSALLERAGGNPLYAEEFVRMLVDRSILSRPGDVWTIASGAEVPLPDSVQALIAARLDTLSAERKAMLQDAAVMGKVFWSGAVAAMGGRAEDEVREGLHELARKELVRPARRSSVEGQAEYAFWHALVRDVSYAQIPRAERAAKHRSAAGWIEAMAGERASDHAELLVHHYSAALQLSEAAGSRDEDLVERARRSLVMAAERSFELDVGRARSYLERALELLGPDDPERARLLLRLGEAVWLSEDVDAAVAAFEGSTAAFRVSEDGGGEAEALVQLAHVLRIAGESERARGLLAEALALLEGVPPGRSHLAVYHRLAFSHMLAGHAPDALDWAERCIALGEELGADDELPRFLQFRGVARCGMGDRGGLDDLRRALDTSLERGRSFYALVAHNNLGDWVWQSEGSAPALELYQQGMAFAERRGLSQGANWAKAQSLWPMFDLGRWDELLEVAQQVIGWEARFGRSQTTIFAETWRTYVMACRGVAVDHVRFEQDTLARAREAGDSQALAPALAVAAFAARCRGDLAAAMALEEEVLARSREWRGEYFRVLLLPEGVRTAVAAGRRDLAEAMFEDIDTVWLRHRLALTTGRAIVAEADGDLEGALAGYLDVAEGWRDYGHVLEHGLAMLGAGRCAMGLGRSVEAGAGTREALDVFEGLQARPYVKEAEALLTGATATGS